MGSLFEDKSKLFTRSPGLLLFSLATVSSSLLNSRQRILEFFVASMVGFPFQSVFLGDLDYFDALRFFSGSPGNKFPGMLNITALNFFISVV